MQNVSTGASISQNVVIAMAGISKVFVGEFFDLLNLWICPAVVDSSLQRMYVQF